ncbi:hypothetical protein PG985_008448 [Apiospora marii]|uniref:Uncharacterized protein n=1 Tax=Apiospora marii TaxID=335849 RepID=A0ABR1STF4_9PEZI
MDYRSVVIEKPQEPSKTHRFFDSIGAKRLGLAAIAWGFMKAVFAEDFREMRYEGIFLDNKRAKGRAHDWRPKVWRRVVWNLPRPGPVARRIWCFTAPFAYLGPFIMYAAHSATRVREWDTYMTVDWRVPPEVERAWYRDKKPPSLGRRVDEKIAAWGYPVLYAAAGFTVWPLSPVLGRRFQSPAWREFNEYLRREIPRHLRADFIKADGRFTYPRGMYVTCLSRMWPLFVFVWWTRVKVRGRKDEAMERYRSEGQEETSSIQH